MELQVLYECEDDVRLDLGLPPRAAGPIWLGERTSLEEKLAIAIAERRYREPIRYTPPDFPDEYGTYPEGYR